MIPNIRAAPEPIGASTAYRVRIEELTHAIADRLIDVDKVLSNIQSSANTVAYGLPGISLFLLEMAQEFPSEGWGKYALSYMRRTAMLTAHEPIAWPGLLDGTAGLAMVLQLFALWGEGFRGPLLKVGNLLALQTLGRRPVCVSALSEADYDWANGSAGILRSMSLIAELTPEAVTPAFQSAQRQCREELGCFAHVAPEERRWTIPPDSPFTVERERALFPDGYVDLGFAHGLAGVLSTLALETFRAHRDVANVTIQGLSEYLVDARLDSEASINWPRRVPPANGRVFDRLPARTAWCYGAGGITYALVLAGRATGSQKLTRDALEAAEAIAERSVTDRRLESSCLCHGSAGLLCILARLRAQSPSWQFLDAPICDLIEQILVDSSERHQFIIRDFDPVRGPRDDPGLLTGAAGVGLALIAASTRRPPLWDAILGLS